MSKRYVARPEFIGRNKETEGLYNLEARIVEHIEYVCNWRVEHLGEDYWTEALPQTLHTTLEAFDHHASEVAAKCFLSGNEEVKEVEWPYPHSLAN